MGNDATRCRRIRNGKSSASPNPPDYHLPIRRLVLALINILTLISQAQDTKLEQDRQFDSGSGIVLGNLTDLQVDNLVTPGKVWGFLKYHHPQVTSGQRQWDYDLLRILPAILKAQDRPTANAALLGWTEQLGSVAPCHPCAKLEQTDLYFRPGLDWIANNALLGDDLSKTLQSIWDNRVPSQQFYVGKVPNVGNPSFEHELAYENLKLPDSGFQLLALYRFWNIIEYWSPNRDIVGENWNTVLSEFIPRIALAQTAKRYQLEMLALIAKAHDGHANLWHALDVRPPVGPCRLPAYVRFIEHLPVVSGLPAADPASIKDLQIGDAITELDGVPVAALIDAWMPYYSASNEAARLRDVGRSMTGRRVRRNQHSHPPRQPGTQAHRQAAAFNPERFRPRRARFTRTRLPLALERCRLPQTLLGKVLRRPPLRRASDRHKRTDYRHSQLPVGLHGLLAGVAVGRR